MYWEHGYTAKDIMDRLRLSEQLVRAILAKDYVETTEWDEDSRTYITVRTARTRNEKPQLIIPTRTPVTTSKEDQIRQQLDRLADSAKGIQTPLHWIMNKG